MAFPVVYPVPLEILVFAHIKELALTISRAGFGVMLAIIILLAITCAILAVLLIIFCIKAAKGCQSEKSSPEGEKIAMT